MRRDLWEETITFKFGSSIYGKTPRGKFPKAKKSYVVGERTTSTGISAWPKSQTESTGSDPTLTIGQRMLMWLRYGASQEISSC